MLRDSATLHFVLSATEYHYSHKPLKTGDVLIRNGGKWTVTEVKNEADGNTRVTLRLVQPEVLEIEM